MSSKLLIIFGTVIAIVLVSAFVFLHGVFYVVGFSTGGAGFLTKSKTYKHD